MPNQLLANAAQSLTNERLKLILYPTEQCNFRCLYCYEDHLAPQMNRVVINAIKGFLQKRIPLLKLFELEWFGGEPLLAKDIITEITSFSQELCQRYSVTFISTMTTNGFLLNVSTLKHLLSLGIRSFQISFDGDRDNHNRFRIMPNFQQGTFDTIWNNLVHLKNDISDDFSIAIRCHLTAINSDSIESLLGRITETFADDKRFFVHLKEVSALGGPNDNQLHLLSKSEKIQLISTLKKKYNKLNYIDIGEDYICYAAKPNCIAVRSNGNLIKCTVAMDDEMNQVGKLNSDGSLAIDQEKFFLWSKGFESMNRSQLDCPYYHCIKIKVDGSNRET